VGDEEDTSIGSFVEDERTPGPADATSNALLAEALKEHGVPYVFEEYPGVGHGVGVGKGLVCEPWMEHAIAFWDSQRECEE
jgi:acetyl esterase/lipase